MNDLIEKQTEVVDEAISPLLQLPLESFLINTPLDWDAAHSLSRSCQWFGFFRANSQGENSVGHVYELLHCFELGDYVRADKIVHSCPSAIFRSVNYRFTLSQKEHCVLYTSPLRYALETNNQRMLALFKQVVEPDLTEQFKCFERQYKATDSYRLIELVAESDYDGVEKIIKVNPELMFKHVIYDSENQLILPITGEKYKAIYQEVCPEYISPLKLAFKNYDSHMWSMFYELIKEDPRRLELFKRQNEEQNELYDIGPLLNAYDQYLLICEEIHKNHSETGQIQEDVLTQSFNEVGLKQRNAPRHLLLEIFRQDPLWGQVPDSGIKTSTRPPLQYLSYFEDEGDINISRLFAFLGQDLSIVRGESAVGALFMPWTQACNAKKDRDTLENLFRLRQQELAGLLTLPEPEFNPINP
ncbi:hypothetical protein [Legionella sp. 16cNR16C]|uniref:hypothetical protein n=1 Tax=Legionella sp. 16cNR16C TaxID=2905656 RepID=UPI001E418F05|nr:hypothetical protein [Legionella sp. 16cNR16C]MCE3046434.1 hypothetical protein [Legionella sp. 16cNR16C]